LKDKIILLTSALVVVASIFLYYQFPDMLQVGRVGIVLTGVVIAGAIAYSSDPGRKAWIFAKGANLERQKVVWPTRREAMMVTIMVVILVIIIGLFIAIVDKIMFEVIYDFILGVSE